MARVAEKHHAFASRENTITVSPERANTTIPVLDIQRTIRAPEHTRTTAASQRVVRLNTFKNTMGFRPCDKVLMVAPANHSQSPTWMTKYDEGMRVRKGFVAIKIKNGTMSVTRNNDFVPLVSVSA